MNNRPLRWTVSGGVWTARPDDSAPYHVAYSGGLYRTTLGSGTPVGSGSDPGTAMNLAQLDYDMRRTARQVGDTVVPTAQLLTAMRDTITIAYRNLAAPAAVAVAVAVESIAEAVGIDPADLRSETRP